MIAYLTRRILLAIPTVIGVCFISFALFYLVRSPESLARQNISSKHPTPAQIHGWIVQHGYDKPMGKQFETFMGQLLLFHFGSSDVDSEPIADKIRSGFGPSLVLAVPEFLVGTWVTIALALFVAYYRGTYVDTWGTFCFVLMMSISVLLYIIAGQYIFGKLLKLAPVMGFHWGLSTWKFIVLPATVGVLAGIGGSVRFYRTVMLEEMNQDYVRTARAKGAAESTILFRHILKNSMIPILTAVAMAIPFLFTGSILMESFFGIPGLGNLTYTAVQSGDFAVIRVMVYIGSLLYILGTILTDISYALADPRVRVGAAAQ
ncbi:MAG TPA: ABC transporter permease [Armatimonadota bacterium]|nr:ABC transporter permease [Armatimonadota bacterium]